MYSYYAAPHSTHAPAHGHDSHRHDAAAYYENPAFDDHAAPPHDASYGYSHGPVSGPSSCIICRDKVVPFPGAACSRRCGWVAQSCCPQCGRQRGVVPGTFFCSANCAGEARQANWCVGCGVRQLGHGQQSCGAPECVASVHRIASRIDASRNASRPRAGSMNAAATTGSAAAYGAAAHHMAAAPSRQQQGRGKRYEPHTALSIDEKQAGAVRQQLGSDIARRVPALVKIGGAPHERKTYTAYRNRVEGEMNDVCGIGAPKFGAGGEGNEHRRFVPLVSDCGARPIAEAAVRTCGSPRCQVCSLLDHGVAAMSRGALTIPAFSSAAKALQACEAAETTMAILVVRVAVGNAEVGDAAPGESAMTPPSLPRLGDQVHSVVRRHAGFDVAHVPTTVASVDPQFLAFVASA